MKIYNKRQIEKMYLDYVNNFLTSNAFAEYYGISYKLAELIIDKCRNDGISTNAYKLLYKYSIKVLKIWKIG